MSTRALPLNTRRDSPHPAQAAGDETAQRRAFVEVANQIADRINLFRAFRGDPLDDRHVRSASEQFTPPGASA